MKRENLFIASIFIISIFLFNGSFSFSTTENLNDNNKNQKIQDDSILILSKLPADFDSTQSLCADTIYNVNYKYIMVNDTLNIRKSILIHCDLNVDSVLSVNYNNWLLQFINN
ncbi:MAG: hypothetical protein IAE65_11510 [Ignavibacteria bacterium]|nr:hypothetical protein [Ignavibacteria bacterium]